MAKKKIRKMTTVREHPMRVPISPKNPSGVTTRDRHVRRLEGTALGIAQITPETYKIVQDPNGEVKEFIFKNLRKKDLKDPSIAIPIAVSLNAAKTDGLSGRSFL